MQELRRAPRVSAAVPADFAMDRGAGRLNFGWRLAALAAPHRLAVLTPVPAGVVLVSRVD